MLGEELKDIVVRLEQRFVAQKNRLQQLEKTRKQLEEEITAIKRYLELGGTLCRVGADNAKLASLPSQIITDEKGIRPLQVMNVTDQCREILLGRNEYVGMSVPEEACRILREAKRSMHAEELLQRLYKGGMQSKGDSPSLRSPTHSRERNVSGKWALIPLKLWKKTLIEAVRFIPVIA